MGLIDKDALMKWANDHYDFEAFTVGYFAGIIQDMPTVDAEPVRHGKWLRWRENGTKRCKCSECFTSYGNMDTPYCPNCGARMDGAERKEE